MTLNKSKWNTYVFVSLRTRQRAQRMEMCIDFINLDQASDHINDFKSWIANRIDPDNYPPTNMFFLHSDTDAIGNLRESISQIQTSNLASAKGLLPLHILSKSSVPWDLFRERDSVPCEVYYNREKPNLFQASVSDSDFTFFFSIPKQIVDHYRRRMDVDKELGRSSSIDGRMRDFKRTALSSIDVPILHNGVKRFISFQLDQEWLDKYM